MSISLDEAHKKPYQIFDIRSFFSSSLKFQLEIFAIEVWSRKASLA